MFSLESRVKEIKANEAATDIVDKYMPGFKTDPRMKNMMVQSLSLKKLASFPQSGISADKVEELDAELKALGD